MAVVMIAVALTANMTTMLVFCAVDCGLWYRLREMHPFLYKEQEQGSGWAERRTKSIGPCYNDMGATLDGLQREQQRLRLENDPSPEIILDQVKRLIGTLWSRRPADDDFLSVRVGVGAVPSIVVVKAPPCVMRSIRIP